MSDPTAVSTIKPLNVTRLSDQIVQRLETLMLEGSFKPGDRLPPERQLAEQRVQRLEGLEGTVPRKEIEAARTEASSLAERERSIGTSL